MTRRDIEQLTSILKGHNFKPTNFIEVGSRDGHDTDYVCHYWRLDPSDCYIIEAHPDCYNYIVNTYPQYQTYNIAASDKTEPVRFNAGVVGEEENIGISSVLNRTWSPFISREVEVDGWRMDEVMSTIKVDKFDFMKIDVEGFGLQVLQGFGDKLRNTTYIQIELENKQIWEGQAFYDDVVNYLTNLGFSVIDQVCPDGIQSDVLFENKNN